MEIRRSPSSAAGSTYTPELIEGFAARAERLGLSELVLHDIDAERLDIVGGLARRILDGSGFARPARADRRPRGRAIEGAGFVLVQLRVGGLAARLLDETIPPRFGCLGQETTGAGGFAKALRTVPVVLDIAARHGPPAAPRARGCSTSRTRPGW